MGTFKLVTARKALAEIPAHPEALIDRLLPLGVITLLAAAPKAGKTTFAWHMVHSVLTGENFADREAAPGAVVWMGSDSGWKTELATRDAAEYPNLYFPEEAMIRALKPYGTNGEVWREALESLQQEIISCGAKLLVIDHLLGFAIGDDGADRPQFIKPWLEAISQVAEECNISVLVLVHNSKGGDVPHSYAILAIVRHILRLTRGRGRRISVNTKGNLYPDSRVAFSSMSPEGYTLDEPKSLDTSVKQPGVTVVTVASEKIILNELRSKLKEAPEGLSIGAQVKWLKENSDFGMSESTLRRRLKEL